jgi:hypothetical protein
VVTLSNRDLDVESKNLIVKKLLDVNKVQEALHPLNDALHGKILDLKNNHEEI